MNKRSEYKYANPKNWGNSLIFAMYQLVVDLSILVERSPMEERKELDFFDDKLLTNNFVINDNK